jgi:hypothetical protein
MTTKAWRDAQRRHAEYRRELWRLLGELHESWRSCPKRRCPRDRMCRPDDPVNGGCAAPRPPPRNLTPQQEADEMADFYNALKARYEASLARSGEAGAAG